MLVISTVFMLYAVRELHLKPVLLGLIFAALGSGFLLDALVAGRAARCLGVGRTMIAATLLNAFAATLMPLASGSLPVIIFILIAAHFLLAFGIQTHGINLVSLRQAMTPHRLQGRMNASGTLDNQIAIVAE